MHEPLPSIHIVVKQTPALVLRALASVARQVQSHEVELIERPSFVPEWSAVNVRYRGVTLHKGLSVQFIAYDDEPGRISVEVRATTWMPVDPPSYSTYVRAANLLTSPLLSGYHEATSEKLRLRVSKPEAVALKLPPAARKLFVSFAGAANASSLHPNDWGRFYDFVRRSKATLDESEMTRLLVEHEFSLKQARRLADIYVHLREFKATR